MAVIKVWAAFGPAKFGGLHNLTSLSAQSVALTDQLRDRLTVSNSLTRTPERKTVGYAERLAGASAIRDLSPSFLMEESKSLT